MMRKKLLAMFLTGVMTLSMLTACGGKETEVVVSDSQENVETAAAPEAEGEAVVSDETFAGLQESYNGMVEVYNAVLELYSSDEIAANPDIEAVLGEVKGIMDEMGEITQETITEEDAVVLLESIITLLDSMELLVDGMETVEATTEGDFTLLDVNAEMITAAIYVSNETSEMVLSLFTAPDGTEMCSMLEYDSAAETGDVACGAYAAETATDENGVAWTYLTFQDVYTESAFEMGFGETDGGECYLLLPSGDIYEAKYLNNEEAIAYMGTAVALLAQ